MAIPDNPYESPIDSGDASSVAPAEARRSGFEKFLLVVWLIEANIKAFMFCRSLGFNPLPFVVGAYQQMSWWLFLLSTSFITIETIGPWVGIYYLTGRRSRVLSFDQALSRILMVAVLLTIAIVLALTLYCQFVGG